MWAGEGAWIPPDPTHLCRLPPPPAAKRAVSLPTLQPHCLPTCGPGKALGTHRLFLHPCPDSMMKAFGITYKNTHTNKHETTAEIELNIVVLN